MLPRVRGRRQIRCLPSEFMDANGPAGAATAVSTDAEQPVAAEPGVDPPAGTTPVVRTSARIVSLDVARGLMLVVSVAVNAWYTMPEWFGHAAWAGVHPVDLVFPVFVTLSGCGLGLAYHRRVPLWPTLRRFVVLLAAGLVYNGYLQFLQEGRLDLGTLRWTGVLQLYAVLVVVAALVHLVLRWWWAWVGLACALALAGIRLLASAAADCPGGVLTRTCNPSGPLDSSVFGAAHIYLFGRAGHDPEGLITLIGASVSIAAGASVGHLLLSARAREWQAWRRAMLVVAGGVAMSLLWWRLAAWAPPSVPAMKRLWTPPFALSVAAGVTIALVLLHLVFDLWPSGPIRRALSWPLVALGRNSLLVYFGSHAVMETLLLRRVDAQTTWADVVATRLAIWWSPQVSLIVAAVALWLVIAAILHRYRIYLRP